MTTTTETHTDGQVACPPWCNTEHEAVEVVRRDITHHRSLIDRADDETGHSVCGVSLLWTVVDEDPSGRVAVVALSVADHMDMQMTPEQARSLASVMRGDSGMSQALVQGADMLEGPYRLPAPGDIPFTLEQVALILGLHHDSVAAMVLSDEIEWCVVAGEARVPAAAVSAYIARNDHRGGAR